MRLISVDTLRTALGEMDLDDVNQLLDTAINLVTLPIEQLLNASFTLGSYTDYFQLDMGISSRCSIPTLALSKGFILAGSTPEVRVANSFAELATASPTTSHYEVLSEQGLLIFPSGIEGLFVQVNYSAGIDAVDELEYNEDLVPEWLKHTVIIWATNVFSRLVAVKSRSTDTENKPKNNIDLLAIPPEINPMVGRYRRWHPTAHQPMLSV